MSPSGPGQKPDTNPVTQESLTPKQIELFAAAAERAGLSMAQLDEILGRVSGDRGALEAFFRREKMELGPNIDWYDVPINCRLTPEEIIAGLKQRLDSVDYEITAENFPVEKGSDEGDPSRKEEAKSQVKMAVVHFDRIMKTAEIQKYFKANNLRAATLEELAAFEQEQPEIQRKYPVAALGDSKGYVNVPFLNKSDSKRHLSLFWDDPRGHWNAGFRFLALPK